MNRKALLRSVKRVGAVGLLLLAAALIIAAVERKEDSLTTSLSIAIEPLAGGHLLITERDVRDILDKAFGFSLEGAPLEAIDLERLERVLEEESFVAEANAFIDANNHIEISLRQRQPVLRVLDENGLDYYLDRQGTRMPPSEHYTARVLVATGHLPPHVPDFLERPRHTLRHMFTLAGMIREDPLLDPLIEQAHLTAGGNVLLIPKVGKQVIRLGSFEGLTEKLDNLKVFYREALPYEGWDKYETIDLSFRKQVVAKRS